MPGAGSTHVGLEHGLHALLVAEVVRHVGAHARDAERVAHLAERDLQLLEHPHQRVDAAEMPGHRACGIGDLLRIGPVGDAVVARSRARARSFVVGKHGPPDPD